MVVRARAATVNRARRGDALVRRARVNQVTTTIHRVNLAVRAVPGHQEAQDRRAAPEVQAPREVLARLANQAAAMTANELSQLLLSPPEPLCPAFALGESIDAEIYFAPAFSSNFTISP